ncbi:MAG TPA: hypothetical protein VHY31_27960 [Streptosporangiaceae bacterium]|nr:hypothetical protein [Streptosporangiaceae bacterium]
MAAIATSVAAMVLIGLAGPSAAVPAFRSAAPWPPYFGHLSLSPVLVAFASWAAVLIGGAGVGAGLVAVGRGWRPRPRNVIIGAILAVVALALVPPIGSTDMLDYAVYGRIAALGHSPYVMTPARLKAMGDPVGAVAPIPWQHDPSVYGPLATVTEKVASLLGGSSVARTLLWLKVWNGLAFLGIAITLDRLLRSDPMRRMRAHLLWSVNPLMLLAVMTGGHIDGLAAVFGLLGLLAFRRAEPGQPTAGQPTARQPTARQPTAGQPSADRALGVGLRRAVVAGVLVGVAVAVKAPFALFAIGLAWAGWRSVRTLAAAGLGLAVVLVPSYLLAGKQALLAAVNRGVAGVDLYQPWQLLYRTLDWHDPSHRIDVLAVIAAVALAVLLLRRMPEGPPGLPAIRVTLALSLAWLVTSPQQRPWFDAMIFPLLAVMPATQLDWIALLRAVVASAAELPGVLFYTALRPHWLAETADILSRGLTPLVLLAATVWLIWFSPRGEEFGPRGGDPPVTPRLGAWGASKPSVIHSGQPPAGPPG